MLPWLWLLGVAIPWCGGFHLWFCHKYKKSAGWGSILIWTAATAFVTLAAIVLPGIGVYSALMLKKIDWAPFTVMVITSLLTFFLLLIWLRQWCLRQAETPEQATWILLAVGAVNGIGLGPNLLSILICFIVLTLSVHQLFFSHELLADIQADKDHHRRQER